jgi:hypothetical protein
MLDSLVDPMIVEHFCAARQRLEANRREKGNEQ